MEHEEEINHLSCCVKLLCCIKGCVKEICEDDLYEERCYEHYIESFIE